MSHWPLRRSEISRIAEDVMKLPGPDHPIAITKNANRIVVTFGGREVANSTRALTMLESTYPAVHYIPREDVDMVLLERTTHGSHCPYKGDANYFSVRVDGKSAENAVWTYEAPFDAVAPIKDHLAFYPNRVDRIEERPAQSAALEGTEPL
jgi:uncharacterized protein (DUF427 family)